MNNKIPTWKAHSKRWTVTHKQTGHQAKVDATNPMDAKLVYIREQNHGAKMSEIKVNIC